MNQVKDDKKVRDKKLKCDVCGKPVNGFFGQTSVTCCNNSECKAQLQEDWDALSREFED